MKTKIKDDSIDQFAGAAATACFLHDLFRYPAPLQWKWLQKKDVVSTLHFLLQRYLPDGQKKINPFPSHYAEYEETYLATFEVGLPHPPCPLIESHWNKSDPTPKILHENILYYKKFGLHPKDEAKESADHLRFQLEFFSYLTNLLATAEKENNPEMFQQILNARSEYHQRHLMSWIPKAVKTLQHVEVCSWAAIWIELLERFLVKQAEHLQSIHQDRST